MFFEVKILYFFTVFDSSPSDIQNNYTVARRFKMTGKEWCTAKDATLLRQKFAIEYILTLVLLIQINFVKSTNYFQLI